MVIAKSVRQKELYEAYRETFPIRTPNAIQPHGILLAMSPDTWQIQQVSRNTQHFLGHEPTGLLGQPLSQVLGESQVQQIQASLSSTPEPANPIKLTIERTQSSQHFDGILHQTDAFVVLELEPTTTTETTGGLTPYQSIQSRLRRMQQVAGLTEFLQLITAEIQDLSGFDRVMVYRFMPDHGGVVEAESKVEAMSSYLGLRFPATDIPQAARTLFHHNPLRHIPNIHYEPVPLVRLDQDDADSDVSTLDMKNAVLRHASPCHLEYLANMGVAASMVIPLICDQQLWGLISCHHQQPQRISYEIRCACEFLAHIMCLELASKVEQAQLDYRLNLQQIQNSFSHTLAQADNLTDALTQSDEQLLTLVDATGVAICLENDITCFGATPSPSQVSALLHWATTQANNNFYQTDTLAEQYPDAEAYSDVASGLLLLQISRSHRYVILWFRPEVIQTVNWAGDPAALAETAADDTIVLNPRKSFEIWQETVRHCARPWQPEAIDSALELRSLLVGIVLNRADELATLNTELARSNQELDSFAFAASHDLQEPLRGIHTYATFLLEDYEEILDAEGCERIQHILQLTRRMDSLINSLLYFSRLGQTTIERRPIDLNIIADREIQLLRMSRSDDNFVVHINPNLPDAEGDPVLIEELLRNLLSNAIKYNKQSEKHIEIGYCSNLEDAYATSPIYYVRDNGIGIKPQHQSKVFQLFKRLHSQSRYGGGTGAGLTIAHKIVERHGGRIWLESTDGQGSTFYFTLGP